jgi:transcriptional regulator with GAF, ATPase, and Fis domain
MRERTKSLSLLLPEVRVGRFRVEVSSGPDVGATAVSNGDEFAIGTAEGNQLLLKDASVSRHHAAITSGTRSFHVRDLDSTNGTQINGLRIDSAHLSGPARIRVGVTTLHFSILEDTVRHDLSMTPEFQGIVGRSVRMRKLFAALPAIAAAEVAVLLLGETGTGKTALAKVIHEASPRASEPFVVIDCASIPASLIESELFGHERGSFTGANERKLGVFEAAGHGTVLLDELGELPLSLQPKLLRVLEQREIRRVGGTSAIDLHCRILAATNRDLRAEVNASTFRNDLLYRLNTVTLRLPPLRERRQDIPLLVQEITRRLETDGQVESEVVEQWSKREWPGNVRELRSAIERHLLLGPNSVTDSNFPPPPSPPYVSGAADAAVDATQPFREAKDRAILEWERKYLLALLSRTGDNLSRAAREGRMDRGYLRGLLKKHGIR